MQAAAEAAKEKMSMPVFSLAASAAAAATTKSEGTNPIPQPAIQAQTRIRVFNFAGTARIGTSTWLSSTSQWASAHSCDGTALVSLVQRYYANNFGRFMSPDWFTPSGRAGDPGTWNRYAYAGGDPINKSDPSGLDVNCYFIDGEFVCIDDVTGLVLDGGLSLGGFPGSTIGNPLFVFALFGPPPPPPGFNQARSLLSNPKCAKAVGAASSADAISKLNSNVPTLRNLGELLGQSDANGNVTVSPNSPPLAEANSGFLFMFLQSITINNWGNYFTMPQHVEVSINGQQTFTNLLQDQASLNGISGFSSVLQYQEFTILHELKHLFPGAPPDDTPAQAKAFNRSILQDCFGLTVN
jgi:RHS repeat-associated protein